MDCSKKNVFRTSEFKANPPELLDCEEQELMKKIQLKVSKTPLDTYKHFKMNRSKSIKGEWKEASQIILDQDLHECI